MDQKDISSGLEMHYQWGQKMETSYTLIPFVAIFETRVKHCRRKNDLVLIIPGTSTGNWKAHYFEDAI